MKQSKFTRREPTTADAIQAALRLLRHSVTAGTTRVEEMHRAIARRPFRALNAVPGVNQPSGVVEAAHDGIAGSVYGTIRLVTTLVLSLAEAVPAVVAQRATPETRPPTLPVRDSLISAINGAVGDYLERDRSSLAIDMSFCHHGRPLTLDAVAIRRAHPRLTGRLCIFAHGLACNESAWDFYSEPSWGRQGVNYATRLQQRRGYTPFFARYNTGRHISENGRDLAHLIERLVAAYPIRPREIVLVGHSMGGLVARSACHYGQEHALTWTKLVSHVVCLGSPHLGAPLEKFANVVASFLRLSDITAPIARVMNGRSVGVKDLRYGYVVDDDWQTRDPDAFLDDGRTALPFLPTAQYHFVGASWSTDVDHPSARVVGDMLVTVPSASGRHRKTERGVPFDPNDGLLLGGLSHLRLLNHPAVYDQIERWLGDRRR